MAPKSGYARSTNFAGPAGGLVVFGVYELALHRFPAERTWDLYKQELELDGNERLLDSVTPAIGPTEDGGFSLGVVGKF